LRFIPVKKFDQLIYELFIADYVNVPFEKVWKTIESGKRIYLGGKEFCLRYQKDDWGISWLIIFDPITGNEISFSYIDIYTGQAYAQIEGRIWRIRFDEEGNLRFILQESDLKERLLQIPSDDHLTKRKVGSSTGTTSSPVVGEFIVNSSKFKALPTYAVGKVLAGYSCSSSPMEMDKEKYKSLFSKITRNIIHYLAYKLYLQRLAAKSETPKDSPRDKEMEEVDWFDAMGQLYRYELPSRIESVIAEMEHAYRVSKDYKIDEEWLREISDKTEEEIKKELGKLNLREVDNLVNRSITVLAQVLSSDEIRDYFIFEFVPEEYRSELICKERERKIQIQSAESHQKV
jgi:hypothetical protein